MTLLVTPSAHQTLKMVRVDHVNSVRRVIAVDSAVKLQRNFKRFEPWAVPMESRYEVRLETADGLLVGQLFFWEQDWNSSAMAWQKLLVR